MNPFLNRSHDIYSAIRPILIFALMLVGFLTLSRILLVIWQWDRVSEVGMLLPVFTQGLRFDLVLVGITCAIPVLLFPLLVSTHRMMPVWRMFLRIYLPTILLLAIFMELATPSFVNQFDSRPNALFFEYLNHPKEVTAMLWTAYKMPLIFAAMFISATGLILTRKYRKLTANISGPGFVSGLLFAPILLIVCLGLVRSTLDHRSVNPSTVATSKDPLVNELALSSAYTALYALYEKRLESEGGFRYGEIADEDVISEVRASMEIPEQEFVSEQFPTMHFQWTQKPATKPKNLVIIVEESLGAEFVGSLGGLDLIIFEFSIFQALFFKPGLEESAAAAAAEIIGPVGLHVDEIFFTHHRSDDKS